MSADYYEQVYQKTFKEWKKFVSGDSNVDQSIIPPELLDSWRRCKALRVDPNLLPKNRLLTGEELDLLLLKNKEFIDISRPYMNNLYRFLEGSGFLVSLFDRDAFILEVIGDLQENQIVRSARGFVGACWDEQNAGNNAAGTVVVERKPMQVFEIGRAHV